MCIIKRFDLRRIINRILHLFYINKTFICNLLEDMEVEAKAELKVVNIDLKSEENGKRHHTGRYDVMRKGHLVVRRGQAFTVGIDFSRPYDNETDDVRLVFTSGND